jgi:hypothetical protein
MIFYQICYTLNISSSWDAVLLRVVEKRLQSRRAYVSYQGCMCCLYSICDQCRSIQPSREASVRVLGRYDLVSCIVFRGVAWDRDQTFDELDLVSE